MVAERSDAKAHPYGVLPSSNLLLLKDQRDYWRKRLQSLGPFLARCSDEILLQLLTAFTPEDLLATGCCSHFLFVFTSHDAIWKDIMLQRWTNDMEYRVSWKRSYTEVDKTVTLTNRLRVYSDALYKPWQYGTASILPEWLEHEHGEILDAADLSIDEFLQRFERPGMPLLLRNVLAQWDTYIRPNKAIEALNARPEAVVRVGPVPMKMRAFLRYSAEQLEENPLYAFDARFDTALPELSTALNTPLFFKNSPRFPNRDLFENMGEERRPDYRWIIIGAAKSGSKWHVDPNHTHAWNALVRGQKLWIMFPPEQAPPGVFASPDGLEVAQPVSLMEWFMNYYDEARKLNPVQFIANPGDLVFVPSQWWHCVLNLDFSVAVTQNYIAHSNLACALAMMKYNSHLVSGIPTSRDKSKLYDEFVGALSAAKYEETRTLLKRTLESTSCRKKKVSQSVQQPLDWKRLKPSTEASNADFKFTFF